MTAGRRGVTEQAASAAIEQACRMLRLPTMRDRFTEIAAAAEREQLSYLGFLAELVMAECDDRDRRRAARRVREAGFPRPKRLEEFSFDANPAVSPAVIGQLATCGWVTAGHPLCLIGDSGTGKTHLLIALGALAAEAGHRVRYTLASKLVNELAEAADERQLSKLIARYGRVDLICLDELGYMELDRRGAELLFQVLTEREERSAIAIASNEPFSKAHMFTATCARRRLKRDMFGNVGVEDRRWCGVVSADGDRGTSGAVSVGVARRPSGPGLPALALFLLPFWEALACPVLSFP